MLSNFQAPEVALDSLAIRQSEVNAWVAGETVPRHYEQVNALLRLGRDYQRLELDVSGVCVTQVPFVGSAFGWWHSSSGRTEPCDGCDLIMCMVEQTSEIATLVQHKSTQAISSIGINQYTLSTSLHFSCHS